MEILKLILTAAPKIITSISNVVRMRRERKKLEALEKERLRIEAEEYQKIVARKRRQEQEAARVRGLHRNNEYRGSK